MPNGIVLSYLNFHCAVYEIKRVWTQQSFEYL